MPLPPAPLPDVERIAEEVFFRDAAEVEQAGLIPQLHFDALADARLFGAFAPAELGGAGLDAAGLHTAVELLASGCLATTFVWIQHFGALGALLNESAPPSLRDRFLPDLITGRRRAGIALGGMQQRALLRATPDGRGWSLSGVSPWVTGWPYLDLLLVAARTPSDELLTALVDMPRVVAGFVAVPQRLAAVDASGTVRLEVANLHVEEDSVVSVTPYDPVKASGEGLRANGSLALGIVRRCCRLIGASPLDDELTRCRAELDAADVHAMPAARAAASALAVRAAALLSVTEGSNSALAGGHADRLTREATFTLVFGSRPAIKTALRHALTDTERPARPRATPTLNQLTTLVAPWALRVAATLRLPDLVASGVGSPPELARAANADAGAVDRLMRFLAAVGVFREASPGAYEPTALSALIEDRGPGCTRDWLDVEGAGGRMDLAWPSLLHAVRTGEPGYPAFFGRTLWEDLDDDGRLAESFRTLMEGHARQIGPALGAAVDWERADSVVDVGGGTGQLLAGLLEAHPHLSGILVELPATAESARGALEAAGVMARCRIASQSFFDPLPAAHTYVLSWILHDWDDSHAREILTNCRRAMRDDGRVILVEHLATDTVSVAVAGMDLRMLTLFASRERNLVDYDGLCAAVGLRRVEVAPLADELAALVYVPVEPRSA